MAVNRIAILNAPDGSITTKDKYQFCMLMCPTLSGNRCYIVCSSVEPDVLDFYHNGELDGRLTSA